MPDFFVTLSFELFRASDKILQNEIEEEQEVA
jgi:hypothetical protein